MTKNGISGKEIYDRKNETRKTWDELSKELGLSESTLRRRVREHREEASLPNFKDHGYPVIVNAMDNTPFVSGEELWNRAISIQHRREKRQDYNNNREVIFDDGPIVLLAMGDLHLGNSGVSYTALDRDILVINQLVDAGIPVAVVLVGDLLDNFIIGRLAALRMTESPFLVIEEWGLVDYVLQRLAPHLVGSVAGNHDSWAWALAGIDLLQDRHERATPKILYDPFELSFTLRVGKFSCKVMARHHWSGHSKFNPTHGIDDWQRRRGREFDIAIGGHTHRGGLAREFDNAGTVGYAMLCGSYKKLDTYGLRLGLPPLLNTSAVAAVVCPNGISYATSNIEALVDRLIK